MQNPSHAPRPSSSSPGRSKKYAIPKWEAHLIAAIEDGLIAKCVYQSSSASHDNLTYTGEFELPGGIPVRFESRPARNNWGGVDVDMVVDPNPPANLNERPGGILPIFSPKGLRQGQVTAVAGMHFGGYPTTAIGILYVKRGFIKRWRHVCGL